MPRVHATAVLPERTPAAPSRPGARGRITAPTLVGARWLREHLDAVRVIDTRRGSDHGAGHVPGACSLPLDTILVEDTSRPAIKRLAMAAQRALADRGIGPDEHIVLVDDADGAAALGATLCELAGARHVTVVHGSGTTAFAALGHDLEHGVAERGALAEDAWAGVQPRLATIAAFEDVVDAVVDGSARIVDARSQLEHEGIVGAPCCRGRGAIPGSVHLEWTAFFDMADEPRRAERVRDIAAHVGLDLDERIIVSCHAGHRAAIAARVLRSAGFCDVRLSLGSWHEWSMRGLGGDEADA